VRPSQSSGACGGSGPYLATTSFSSREGNGPRPGTSRQLGCLHATEPSSEDCAPRNCVPDARTTRTSSPRRRRTPQPSTRPSRRDGARGGAATTLGLALADGGTRGLQALSSVQGDHGLRPAPPDARHGVAATALHPDRTAASPRVMAPLGAQDDERLHGTSRRRGGAAARQHPCSYCPPAAHNLQAIDRRWIF
jgi:hypothetical protein